MLNAESILFVALRPWRRCETSAPWKMGFDLALNSSNRSGACCHRRRCCCLSRAQHPPSLIILIILPVLSALRYSDAYGTVQNALKHAPQSAPLRILQLKVLRGRGLLDQAIKVSTTMVRDGLRSNDVLTERAHCFYLQNNFESAKKHLAEVLRADPDHKSSQQLLKRLRNLTKTKEKGNNAFKAGRWDEAIQSYTECLKFDPELKAFNAQLYCNRAAAQMKKRSFKAACQDCSYAIHLDSTYIKAYQRRAICYEELDDLQKALSDLQTVRTLLSNSRKVRVVSIPSPATRVAMSVLLPVRACALVFTCARVHVLQSTDGIDRDIQKLNVRIKRANRT